LAKEHETKGRSVREAARHIADFIRSKKLLDEVPSQGTIRADIRDLFSDRLKKKPATAAR
jgi:hypothetical protein